MDGNRVVLDISSDEDVGFNWPATDGCDSDIDWTELFVNLERDPVDSQNRQEGYDSDDVVVVKEVFAKPKRTKKSSGVANLAAQHPEEDDDCVILDGDPDKPAAEDKKEGYESDDLVIVAEKGQVACRDYPHSRHLCVKFPFGSTLHSKHCSLCHCYVCDSLAPCGNWGNGNSVNDHCHATEKEELWKSERKRTKQRGIAPVRKIRLNPAPPAFLNGTLLDYAVPSTQNMYFSGETQSYDRPNIFRSQRNSGLSERSRNSPNQSSQWSLNPCTNSLHTVTSSEMFKRSRPIKRRDASVAGVHLASEQPKSHIYTNLLVGHGGVVNVEAHQNSSAVNTSTTSAGPTPSQDQATQAQLYGQSAARANGNLDENVSAPVSSITSEQSEYRLPLTEDQSWNSVNHDVCNWEGLDDTKGLHDLSVLAAENGFHTDSLWTHF